MPNYLAWTDADKRALVSDIWTGLGLSLVNGVVEDNGKASSPVNQLYYTGMRASQLFAAEQNAPTLPTIDEAKLAAALLADPASVDALGKAIASHLKLASG